MTDTARTAIRNTVREMVMFWGLGSCFSAFMAPPALHNDWIVLPFSVITGLALGLCAYAGYRLLRYVF